MSVPLVDKKSTCNIDDEKQENGAGSVDKNWLETTVKKNTMTTENQDFHFNDFEESQSTQMSATKCQQSKVDTSSSISDSKVGNVDDKMDGVQGTTILKTDQDGGKGVENDNKVIVEAEKSINAMSTSSNIDNDNNDENNGDNDDDDDDDDDDIVHPTPPDQPSSLTQRQLLSTTKPHKRKAHDFDDSLAKVARISEDVVIPETQESIKIDEEELSSVIVDNEKMQTQSDIEKKVTDISENTVNDADSKPIVNDELDSLQELSQQLEDVLDAQAQIEIDKGSVEKIGELSEKEKSPRSDVTSTSANGTAKSRMSIELIYEKSLAPPPKPKELVEIDEDGEKIVLDLSQEERTLNDSDMNLKKKNVAIQQVTVESKETNEKNDKKLTNGKSMKLNSDSDSTQCALLEPITDSEQSSDSRTSTLIMNQKLPELLNLISDSEEDSFVNDEKIRTKTIPIEKEFTIVVRVKCILHVDEVSKEITSKEVAFVSCESSGDLHSSRRRTSSALGLADISSGNKSVSPSSVTSNPRPYPLNPRFSVMSAASSSSSSSSGSLKLPLKDTVHFPLPRGVPKHAKKAPEVISYDKDWKNINCLTSSLLNVLNSELMTVDLHNGTVETTNNSSENFRSSTPEIPKENSLTLKIDNKVTPTKRTRSQNIRNSSPNGLTKQLSHSSQVSEEVQDVAQEKPSDDSTKELLISAASTPSRQSARSLSILRNQTPVYDPSDALIGKQCFAKWGDNNYYPGIVSGKSKTKFRINFLDGLSKLLMEDFVVVMPEKLPIGLSIYAAVKDDPYGSCGIITDMDESINGTFYIVETDEGEKLKANISEIFLTPDQITILKESMNEDIKSPMTTPHLGKITRDNIVEGNRRNKTPAISTPKSTRGKSRVNTGKKIQDAIPSVSGVPSKINFESNLDSDVKTSDSNASGTEDDGLGTIQVEIIGTSSEYTTKGPQNRLKGKARSKKKIDDDETIALLGPIPEKGSTLFKGMSFILTCASLESLDKYKMENKFDSNSESGTDFEQEWNSIPFVRDRLIAQINAGGGRVYEKFEDIPESEYQITKLITNVPNITAKSLQCLSVGIPSWNHKWVIRSCLDNKLVNVNHEKLPAGWSLDRKSYVEMSDRPCAKPFNHIIIAVPKIAGAEDSIEFWRQIIENAGGTVRLIDDPSDNFVEATAVLTNRQCPSWIEQRAQTEKIPLVSTTWIVQCLITGVIISHESHVAYFHRSMK